MQEILWSIYIGCGEEEVKDYKGNVRCLSLFELDDSSTLHGASDLLIVSLSRVILDEVGVLPALFSLILYSSFMEGR